TRSRTSCLARLRRRSVSDGPCHIRPTQPFGATGAAQGVFALSFVRHLRYTYVRTPCPIPTPYFRPLHRLERVDDDSLRDPGPGHSHAAAAWPHDLPHPAAAVSARR